MFAVFLRLLSLVAFLTTSLIVAQASSVWGAGPSSASVRYVPYGQSSQNYTEVGNHTDYTVSSLQESNTYYFAATAYDTLETAESRFSNKVSKANDSATTTLISDFSTRPKTGTMLSSTVLSGDIEIWPRNFHDNSNGIGLESSIQALEASAANVGAHSLWDGSVRHAYRRENREKSKNLLQQANSGRISWVDAASQANNARNNSIKWARNRSSPVGRAWAELFKPKVKSIAELTEKYAQEFANQPITDFSRLSQAQQNAVFKKIVIAAGRSNISVDKSLSRLRIVGSGFLVLSIGLSAHAVLTADNHINAAQHELAITSAGIGGGLAGGALAGLACGPGAPICVTIGALVGGSMSAFGLDFWLQYENHMRVANELTTRKISECRLEEAPRSEILINGKPTGKLISGAVLERAIKWGTFYLIFMTDDTPYEEMLRVMLLDNHLSVLDSVVIGAPYCTGSFSSLTLSEPNTVSFRFDRETIWSVELLPQPKLCFPFFSEPLGVWRSVGFSRHIIIHESRRSQAV